MLMIGLGTLLAGASCPGPEPWDCAQEQSLMAQRTERSRAPFYRVREPTSGKYIVTLRQGWSAGMGELSAAAEATAMADLAASYGAADVVPFTAVGQFEAALTAEQRRRLRRDPRVLFIEEDGVKRVSPIAAPEAASWGQDRIDQRQLPLDGQFDAGNRGAAVHAYVLDTGVDPEHREFEGRLGEGHSVFGDRLFDDHGHGTHVAGTLAGATFGVAPEAVVHPVRVLRGGSGADSDVIEGIDWVSAHVEANGWPAVANMSLGGDVSRSLDTALCRSIAAGVVHAVAAGNDASDACNGSPSRVVQALGVGATDKRDNRASFSNRGQCVDLFAPGVDIKSAWRGGGTNVISGTSMASPHAAGVAALTLERHPGESPAEVLERIESVATPGVVRNPGDGPNRLLYARED